MLSITLVLLAWLLPSGLGSFWSSHMIANAYLPDLGLAGQSALVRPASVQAYVALDAALSTLTGAGPRAALNLISMTTVAGVLVMYVSISRRLAPAGSSVPLAVLGYVPLLLFGQIAFLTGYILGPSLLLSLAFFWALVGSPEVRTMPSSHFALMALCWLSLGLMWHSLQIGTLLLACMLTFVAVVRRGATPHVPTRLLAFLVAVAALTWLYVRPEMLQSVLSEAQGELSLFNLFSKGNYAGPHAYMSHTRLEWTSIVRYAGYVAAYALLAWMTLKFVARSHTPSPVADSVAAVLLPAVLCADVVFQTAYFIATGSLAPGLLLFYGIPLLLAATADREVSSGWIARTRLLHAGLAVVFVGAAATAVYVQYTYHTEDVDHVRSLADYESSYEWCSAHLPGDMLFADSATSGHYQVLAARSSQGGTATFNALDIVRAQYEDIANGSGPPPTMPFASNDALWSRHLMFGSLQSWNRFEPIDVESVSQTLSMSAVYSDGRITILV